MAQNHTPDKPEEKIVYVGDSRVKKRNVENIPRDYSAYPGKTEAFVPNFLLKEWMVGAVVVLGFMVLVASHPAPLGYPADPLNAEFIPMPDWYFLFLYQLLKYPYLSEDFVVLGTVVIPGLAFGALLLAPFLDRGKERRFYRRPVASALMLLAVGAAIHLTYVSWANYQNELETKGIVPEHIDRLMRLEEGRPLPPKPGQESAAIPIVDEDSEGYEIYKRSSCVACHSDDLKGTGAAPALLGVGDNYSRERIAAVIKNGLPPQMPEQWELNLTQFNLTEAELETLIDWLAAQKTPAE